MDRETAEAVPQVASQNARLRKPYLLFLGDTAEPMMAKTANGLRDWCGEDVIGQLRLPGGGAGLGLRDMTPHEAADAGAGSLVIGVANFGGVIPQNWYSTLLAAVEAGLDVVSGLHRRLGDVPGLQAAADRRGVSLHDVRHADRVFDVASGRKRTGRRLLTVGTDCALGKKYTALAIARAFTDAGIAATFRATGQTGIMISGSGVAIDATIADFTAGAAEWLSPDNDVDHWDVIEGQGSLFHPAYAAVTLGLLHGSQPDAIVLCHDPSRLTIQGYPDCPIPPLGDVIARYIDLGRLTNPGIRCVGVSLNTATLTAEERAKTCAAFAAALDLPVFDPIADGVSALVDRIRSDFAIGGPE